MTKRASHKFCQICGSEDANALRPGVLLRTGLGELIQKEIGDWSEAGWICVTDLLKYSSLYVQELLLREKGELSSLREEVVVSLHQQEIISCNSEEELQSGLTFGQRLSDRLATMAGSWTFIHAVQCSHAHMDRRQLSSLDHSSVRSLSRTEHQSCG